MNGNFLIGSALEASLYNLSASAITEIFLWLLVAGFLAGMILSRAGRGARFVREVPTLLTSLGILGTFVGIVVGLLHFDPLDIDSSIPALLAGLKTAFITSLGGMGGAILFKILSTTPLLTPRFVSEEPLNAGPEEILNAILDQGRRLDGLRDALTGKDDSSVVGQLILSRQAHTDDSARTRNSLDDLKNAITGTAAGSLIGQIIQMRDEESQRHRTLMEASELDRSNLMALSEKLWVKLDEFAEMLSKAASEQVIYALKEVIADFNRNLTEQFGENFKALDASVHKLVEWQENYRLQLEDMIAQYAQGVTAITQTEVSVAHISERSEQIPQTMERLKNVMEINQHQLDELANHLDAFREIRDRAVDAVPVIRQQVQDTVDEIAASVQAANDHHTTLLERADDYIKEHDHQTRTLLEAFVNTTKDGMETVKEGLKTGAEDIREAIATNAQQLKNQVQEILTKSTQEMTRSVSTASDHYRKLLDLSDDYIEAHDQKTKELLDRFITTTDKGIEQVRNGLESSATATKTAILHGAEEFTNSVDRLKSNLTATSDQIAIQSDQIRQQLEDTFKEVNSHVRVMTDTLANESKQLANTLKTAGTQVVRDTQTTQSQVAESIKQMQKTLESALEAAIAAQTRAMDRSAQALEGHLREAVAKTGEGVNAQLSAIDQAMQQEIQRVMTEMGRALAQISRRFTDDYSKLVNAMQQVVAQGTPSPQQRRY
jgi:translation initiation factor 2 alpha subunit (eIF-2alpha)